MNNNLQKLSPSVRRLALFEAALDGSVAPVRLIIANGASVDVTDNNGRSALMIAASHNKIEVVQALLQLGANLHLKDDQGLTAISLAGSGGHHGCVKILKEAIYNEIAILFGAITAGNTKRIRALVNRGLDINGRDEFGQNALMHAAKCEKPGVASLLLELGADPQMREVTPDSLVKPGMTAMEIAAADGNRSFIAEIEQWLLRPRFETDGDIKMVSNLRRRL